MGATAAGDGVNRFPATVRGAVYLGGRYDCELALADDLALRAELPAGAATVAPEPGDTVWVTIPPGEITVLRG